MLATRDQVLEVICTAIDRVNEQLAGALQIAKSPETRLLGELDSLGFVNLIAAIEELCEQRFGVTLVLTPSQTEGADEEAFATVESLANRIALLLERSRA